MSKQKKFIYTTSEQSAKELKKMGFIEVNHSGNGWTFINDDKIRFSNIENLIITNKLFV